MNERKNYTEKNPLYSVDHLRFVYVQLFLHQLLKAEPKNGQSIHFDEECVTRKMFEVTDLKNNTFVQWHNFRDN